MGKGPPPKWMKTSFKLGVGLAAFEFILLCAAYLNWRQLNVDQEHRFQMGQSWWGCYLLDSYYRSVYQEGKMVLPYHWLNSTLMCQMGNKFVKNAEWVNTWTPATKCETTTWKPGGVRASQSLWRANSPYYRNLAVVFLI